MTFDEAFQRLIGHEGGYVNNLRTEIQYVNEYAAASRSRIGSKDASGAEVGGSCPHSRGRIGICSAGELARVRLSIAKVRASSLRQGLVQRALHPGPQGPADGGAGTRKETRGHLRRVWRANRRKGRLGFVPASLQAGPLRDAEGCGRISFWLQVRSLRWGIPPSSVRFPSSRGQAGLSQRDVSQQVAQCFGSRTGQVHLVVCKLPPTGAPR